MWKVTENVLSHSIHLLIQEVFIKCLLCIKEYSRHYMEIRYLQKAPLISQGALSLGEKGMCPHIIRMVEGNSDDREVYIDAVKRVCCLELGWPERFY